VKEKLHKTLDINSMWSSVRYFFLSTIIILLGVYPVQAQELPGLPQRAVKFIVFGDWGRFGDDHQIQVAQQMAKTAKDVHVDFYVNVGDNFYPKGVASTSDPHWKYSLEEIYKDFIFQKEWYSILGNHDYMGNVDAQVDYTKVSRRWVMPARYYNKYFRLKDGSGRGMQFTFIDTNPLIPEFYTNPEYGPNVKATDSTAQVNFIKQSITDLKNDKDWNIVVGHHPMFTGSKTRREGYDTRRIRNSLKDVFANANVDAYISGHDHSLQHLKPLDGPHQFVSGSASEATDADMLDISKFAAKAYGFLLFAVTSKEMVVYAIDHKGEVLYSTSIEK
jgi:tartrate-resistant acid phosphatase type 5